eukprot:TRINITY_DN4979_c0_g1_i13.p1 TRINITY_DN4979_c0_g1~~TRINITY_DN4979_c0_g1_i13.p1  ORF type:complete len:236 (+),score=30.49 TRINITY_DN4979_c0_g1_i13:371-1078(+)
MPRSQIQSIVAPSKEDHDKVWNWLYNSGIRNLVSYGDAIEGKGNVRVLEKMLNTEFCHYTHKTGRSLVRVSTSYYIPSSLVGLIDMISGIDTFPPVKMKKKYTVMKEKRSNDDESYIVPQSVWSLYKLPTDSRARSFSSQGVIEWQQQYFSPSDLDDFMSRMEISSWQNPIVVGNNDPTSAGNEASLDLEWIVATGLGAPTWFWSESEGSWLYDFVIHFMDSPQVHSLYLPFYAL